MRVTVAVLVALTLLIASMPTMAAEQSTIQGNYVEARSCDVWTGYCFSNGELNLTGEEAIIAWDVTKGSWLDIDLAGLKVVAVVKANATLGDTEHNAFPAKSILVIDQRADVLQKEALIAFAKDAAGELLGEVVRVTDQPIEASLGTCSEATCAMLKAGEMVEIEARCFVNGDKICGHESAVYGPLTDIDNAMTHFTELDKFQGKGLGVIWSESGRRNAYVGTFSR